MLKCYYYKDKVGELMKRKELLWKLFVSTLSLSAFTFGGGYVIVSLMKKTFVDEYHWIDENEMLDFVAIAQLSPGPIAINGAIIIGYKLSGLLGVIVGVIATLIPPLVIVSIVSVFYHLLKTNLFVSLMLEGMQAGVGAVICCVVYEMATGILQQKSLSSLIVMIVSFIVIECFQVSIVWVVLSCIIIGLIQSWLVKVGEKS